MSNINTTSEVNAPIAPVQVASTTAVAVVDKHEPVQRQISYADAFRLAKELAGSQFVPKGFRGRPDDVLAACLVGNEIGLGPIQSLQSLYAIDGRVVMAADKQLALFARYGGRFQWIRCDDTQATISGTWKGATHSVTWDMDRAKTAKLTGKDNWQKYPKAMLRSRAITEFLKDIGFEPTSSMYDPEELDGPATIPAPEPTTQDLERITNGIAELITLNEERGKKSLAHFIANACKISSNKEEADKFIGLLAKTIVAEKGKAKATVPAADVVITASAPDAKAEVEEADYEVVGA